MPCWNVREWGRRLQARDIMGLFFVAAVYLAYVRGLQPRPNPCYKPMAPPWTCMLRAFGHLK